MTAFKKTFSLAELEQNLDRSHELLTYASHGFTHKEVAEMFGLSLETTTRLIWKALNDMAAEGQEGHA